MQKPSTYNTDNPDYLHLRLLFAVKYGKLEEVQDLIEKKVDVNERGNNNTALHYAAVRGHTEIVNALIVANADVALTCVSGGYTALHYAAEYGHAKAGEALINAGANIHARSIKGNTPLAIACILGKEETIEVLLTKGADVHFVSTEGVDKDKTLIEIVASPTNTNLSEAQKLKMIETLFKYGAKIPSALLDNQEISDRIKEKLRELTQPDKIQERDEALLKNEELIEAYKKSILNGNLTLDSAKTLILYNEIFGDLIVKAINSLTKEELKEIQQSGFGELGLGESGASPVTERRGITKAESIEKVEEWLKSLQNLTPPSTAPKTHSEALLNESESRPGKKAKISEADGKSGR